MDKQIHIEKSLKIVLVEDSALIREMVIEELDGISNVSIVAYAEGEDCALSKIEDYKPDLVIIDLELEQGDGIGVLKALQAQPDRYGKLHKVVYTNHNSLQLKERCTMYDIEGYFDKSYQMDDLISYVKKLTH